MLGYNYTRETIKGNFAKQIREAAWRAATRNYNEDDIAAIERQKKSLSQFDVVWDFGEGRVTYGV